MEISRDDDKVILTFKSGKWIFIDFYEMRNSVFARMKPHESMIRKNPDYENFVMMIFLTKEEKELIEAMLKPVTLSQNSSEPNLSN